MSEFRNIPPLKGSLLQEIVLIDRLERDEMSDYKSVSLTGHLIHLITKGRMEEQSNGFITRCGEGDSVWYYENEITEGRITQSPLEFYTISFKAPNLQPPLPGHRVRKVESVTFEKAETLLNIWRSESLPSTERHLRLHALLLDLILDIMADPILHFRVDTPSQLWWSIENRLRLDLTRPINMEMINAMADCSERSLIRSCHMATGLSPLKRIKQLRMAYARSLIQHGDLSISEIAYRVGYDRVHELSRDYRKHFAVSPTEDRKAGPDYEKVKKKLFANDNNDSE